MVLLLSGCNPFKTSSGTALPKDMSIITLTFNVSASSDNQVTTGETQVTTTSETTGGTNTLTTGDTTTTLSTTTTLDQSSQETKGGGDKKE